MRVKILLLQARRADDPVRQEERKSFAVRAGLPLEQIEPHDLLAGAPSPSRLRGFDALMVGGSGDYYVSNRSLPHFEAQLEFLADTALRGLPMFASCFGFQILVAALGGKIIHDLANIEVGTYDLTLTEEGRRDPLLGRLPPVFAAQLGHKDRAETLPEGVLHLAASERSPYQSFRLSSLPVWATQFHPELDRQTNLMRFERYLKGYSQYMSVAERETARQRFRDSPETDGLLRSFLELVFG